MVVWTDVAAGSEVVVGVRIPGCWEEVSTSGRVVTGRDVDGDASVSLVVTAFSEVVDSLVDIVGTAVDTVTVVRVGTGTRSEAVVVAVPGAVVVVSARSVMLTVVTGSADVATVVDGTSDTVVVLGLGVTVGEPRVVDLTVTVVGLVPMVTLAVTGRMVDLSVDVSLGVTLVVTGTLGVILTVVVLVVVVVVGVGVALAVDTSRVVTFSPKVVCLGVAAEVVVCSGDQDGGGVVVAVVADTSTLPVTGCVVSVIGCTVTGLSVVVTSLGGGLVGIVVNGVSGAPGTSGGWGVTTFMVVVAVVVEEIS